MNVKIKANSKRGGGVGGGGGGVGWSEGARVLTGNSQKDNEKIKIESLGLGRSHCLGSFSKKWDVA